MSKPKTEKIEPKKRLRFQPVDVEKPKNKEPKKPAILYPLDIHQRYSLSETTMYLRTSRLTLFKRIKAGHIKVMRDGRRTYVHGSAIAEFSSKTPPPLPKNYTVHRQ